MKYKKVLCVYIIHLCVYIFLYTSDADAAAWKKKSHTKRESALATKLSRVLYIFLLYTRRVKHLFYIIIWTVFFIIIKYVWSFFSHTNTRGFSNNFFFVCIYRQTRTWWWRRKKEQEKWDENWKEMYVRILLLPPH